MAAGIFIVQAASYMIYRNKLKKGFFNLGDIILKHIPEKVIERFFTKFKKLGPDDCWEWEGQKDKDGYGKFSYRIKPNRYFERAHRISAGIYHGDVVEDAIVMHKCDNPSCVNPNHLKIGTHLENEQDKDRKGRRPLDHIRKYTDDQIREVFCMVRDGYREFPRKPRPLAAGMNWQNKFKKYLTNSKYDSILYM
jgi:hypothetical protein